MPDYDAAAALAERLLKDAGRTLPMTRRSGGTYDPVTSTTTGGETLSWNVVAAVFPATQRNMSGLDNGLIESGGLVLHKARRLLVAAKDVPYEPESLDQIVFDGITWTVLACVPLKPAATAIIYKMGVMKQ